MAQANLRAAADAAERRPDCANRLEVDGSEIAAWREAARADVRALRRAARRAPAGPGLHRPRTLGLRCDTGRGLPAVPHLPVPQPVPPAGGQAGGPRACALPARRCLHRRREAARLRVLRGADGARLVAVRVHPIRGGGRGRPPRPGLRLPGGGRAHGPARPRPRRGRRGARRIAGRSVAGRASRASEACGTGTGRSRSHRDCREGIERLAFRVGLRGRRLRVEVTPGAATYTLREDDSELEISHWGERIELAPGASAARPIPPAPQLPAPAQPAGGAAAPGGRRQDTPT